MKNHLLKASVSAIFCYCFSLPVLGQGYYSYYGNKKLTNKAVKSKMLISFKNDVRNKSGVISEIGIDSLQVIIENSLYIAFFKRLSDQPDMNSLRAKVQTDESVTFSSPIFVDNSGSEFALTNQIIVRLKEQRNLADLEGLLNTSKARIVKKYEYDSLTYIITTMDLKQSKLGRNSHSTTTLGRTFRV